MANYTVRKLKVGHSEQLDILARNAGELYSLTVSTFWRCVRKKGLWIKSSSMMRWRNHTGLHAHSADAVVQTFYASLKSWRQLRKVNPDAKPPWRRKYYFKVLWKSSAIKVKDGQLRLSNGKGNAPLILDWHWDVPKQVEIGWDGKQYELRASYLQSDVEPIESGKTAGIDLGEIHLAVAHDGEKTWILNGRLLRSKRRYQNKLKAELASMIDVKTKRSRRWTALIRAKSKQLAKLDNQILDILHKQTTRLINTLHKAGVQKVVIGDVRNIRQGLNYGKKVNQKLHQWLFGKTRHMLSYKAKRLGMEVDLQNEAYTSQECPVCLARHKPKGREYRCKCGFRFHRDGVGSVNIRRKYLGIGPVVGVMASPFGLRYQAHVQCNSASM